MPSEPRPVPTEDQLLDQAAASGPFGRAAIYLRLSGPGWLQGAVTLGGGSLAGALYLGILAGPHLLWLQPFAMLCGIVMLAAIAYVTLSTGANPVETMSRTISPTLAIGWIVATIVADLVFCIAQFALANSTVTQNLLPSLADSATAPWLVGLVLAVLSLGIVWVYDSGGRGIRIFENVLKVMVGVVVLSFFGVVVSLTLGDRLDWGAAFAGLIPDFSQLAEPTPALAASASATGENASIWNSLITDQQRSYIIAAAGAAVGINMTFLLPFSLLKRRWGRRQRGLAIFDLSIGLFIPFVVATSFLVIAAWAAFYNRADDVFAADGSVQPSMARSYDASVDAFLSRKHADQLAAATPEQGTAWRAEWREALSEPDRQMAARLAQRDARQLAETLTPFLGERGARLTFGVGVLAMAWSTMIVHMLMNGLAFSALVKRYDNRKVFMIGAAMPAIAGVLAPALWTGPSRAALAIPAAVIATTLLPIAYFGFMLLMNSRVALGDRQPRGGRRLWWNTLMFIATGGATTASVWALLNNGTPGHIGLVALALLFLIGIVGFLRKRRLPHASHR